MLVIHDETGRINQCIIMAEITLEVLAERYREAGIPHVLTDDDTATIMNAYVADGAVKLRPTMQISGEWRPISAHGRDTIVLRIEPPAVKVHVKLGEVLVQEAEIDDGELQFATNHPGVYSITLEPPFPWLPMQIEIEAVL